MAQCDDAPRGPRNTSAAAESRFGQSRKPAPSILGDGGMMMTVGIQINETPAMALGEAEEDSRREQLGALLRQEAQHYRITDYLSPEEGGRPGPHQVVQACADLVTDKTWAPSPSPLDRSFDGDTDRKEEGSSNRATQKSGFSSSPQSTLVMRSPSQLSWQDVTQVPPPHSPGSCLSSNNSSSSSRGGAEAALLHSNQPSFGFWREQMFDWACRIVDNFDMDRETVAVSFHLLDRYMAYETQHHSHMPVTRDDFQLFSMTCLYLTIKLRQVRKISLAAWVDMSQGFYAPQHVIDTERDILTALQWHLHPPTALTFVRLYAAWLPPLPLSSAVWTTAQTLTEMAVAASRLITAPASVVGLAALLYALRLEGTSPQIVSQFLAQLQGFITTDSVEFRWVYQELEQLYN